MHITYDSEARATYIYLLDDEETTYHMVHGDLTTKEVIPNIINFDYTPNGKLFGIDILDVSKFSFEVLNDNRNS